MYRYGPGLMAWATGTGSHCHLRARDLASGRVSLTLSPGITAIRQLFRRSTRSRLTPDPGAGANCPLRRHPTTRALPAQSGSEQEQGDENAADPREKWQCRHWPSQEGDHPCKASEHGCRNDRALARPDIRAHRCMALRRRWHRRRWHRRRLRTDQPGRDVSGEGAQVRIGPRREHLADPQVELVLGQAALHERGLEHVDHLLAVGVRGPQVAVASRARGYPVPRPDRHRHLPRARSTESVAPVHQWARRLPLHPRRPCG